MEPPPKQGCESAEQLAAGVENRVSVEPPPKQGCEVTASDSPLIQGTSQWNPRRSRGARGGRQRKKLGKNGLSGTPAEAGVRVLINKPKSRAQAVSVEPPPKQGCEKRFN